MGLLAYLEDIPWYLVALGVLAAPGLALWSIMNAQSFWRSRRQTVERSEPIIRKWLDRTKLSVENSPLPDTHHYHLIVSLQSHRVAISRPKDDPGSVAFAINLVVPDADQKPLDSMTGQGDSTLVSDIIIELAQLGIQWQGLNHPLRRISLIDSIIFDERINRDEFLAKISLIIRAQVILGQIISNHAKRAGVQLAMAGQVPSTPGRAGSRRARA